jgi:hypothetical protein
VRHDEADEPDQPGDRDTGGRDQRGEWRSGSRRSRLTSTPKVRAPRPGES